MTMTIKEISREVGREYAVIKRVLRYRFPTDRARLAIFKSVDAQLTREEIEVVREHARRGDWGPWANEVVDEVDILDTELESVAALDTHPLLDEWPTESPSHGFDVRIHNDVLGWFEGPAADKPQRRKLTRYVTMLLERGKIERSKSVRGAGRGWLRALMGGNGGKQFYLWYRPVDWRARDSQQAGVVVVRAVRHHDETSSDIAIGVDGDYIATGVREVIAPSSNGLFVDPLTDNQRKAAHSRAPLQIVRGTPGTGKTTTLHEVISRLTGKVLYLTFDRQLVERTRERDRAFPSSERVLVAETFDDWCAALHGPGREPLSLAAAHRALDSTVAKLPPGELGPWANYSRDLFDELYANAFGRAIPWAWAGGGRCERPLPSRDDYVARRGPSLSSVGAERAWDIADRLDGDQIDTIFGRPVRARNVAERVLRGEFDEQLRAADWDAILVDEVQDLTIVELALVSAVAYRIARLFERLPLLRFAGDEGQTVRPTGFEWTELKKVFAPLGQCTESELDVNLRSPEHLAHLINNATGVLYGELHRDQKPRGTQKALTDDASGGAVLHTTLVQHKPTKAAEERAIDEKERKLFETVGEIPAAAVLLATSYVPERYVKLAADTNCVVMTSAEAKGLDFRVVVFLGAGEALAKQRRLTVEVGGRLDQAFARVSADRLRVAISRATETLVFVDRHRVPEAAELYTELGRRPDDPSDSFIVELPFDDVCSQLDADGADAMEQFQGEINRLQQLIDDNPEAAAATAQRLRALMQRLRKQRVLTENERLQARLWCGRASFRAAVARLREQKGWPDESVRSEVSTRLDDAARDLRGAALDAVFQTARTLSRLLTATTPDLSTMKALTTQLVLAREQAPESRSDLIEVLGTMAVAIATSADTRTEVTFDGYRGLEALLQVVAPGRDSAERALAELRKRAILAIAKSAASEKLQKARDKHVEHARELLASHGGEVTERAWLEAEIFEAERRLDEAGRAYERAKRPIQAVRCYREAGMIRDAHRVASGGAATADTAVLAWANALLELIERRPGADEVLGASESRVLSEALAAALATPKAEPRRR